MPGGGNSGHHQARRDFSAVGRIHVLTYLDPDVVPPGRGGVAGAAAFGGNRAQWDLLRTVLAQPLVSATVLCPARNVHQVEDLLGPIEGLRVAPTGAILDLGLADDPHLVIHHFGQVFDPAPYGLRRIVRCQAPITANHHSLGYRYLREASQITCAEAASPGDALVASSGQGARVIESMIGMTDPAWPGSVVTIPLPTYVKRTSDGQRAEARALLGLEADELCVLSVGRLSPYDKAVLEPLLDAIARLADVLPRIRLVLAGADDGAYGSELRRQAELLGIGELVQIRGDRSDAEIRRLLAGADIFASLYDSHQEIFGLAAAEAQSSSLPCVVSDFSGVSEIVIHEVTGLTVPTTTMRSQVPDLALDLLPWQEAHEVAAQFVSVDRDALCDAIIRLADPALRHRLGNEAAVRAERFAPGTVGARYHHLWLDSLRRSREGAWRAAISDGGFDLLFGPFTSRVVSVARLRWVGQGRARWDQLLGAALVERLGIGAAIEAAATVMAQRGGATVASLREETELGKVELEAAVAVLVKYGYVSLDG